MLKAKKIVLGVSSSVAIYKSLDLIRHLKKRGAEVHVIVTKNASKLISPQLFQAVSGNPVWMRQFQPNLSHAMPHVSVLQEADLVLVVPATANTIGKFAAGVADDLLTTTLLAVKAPILMAPAMNASMWQHPIVQENVQKLRFFGVQIVEPEVGELACGIYDVGHLASLSTILLRAERLLTPQDLKGKRVLISSGPTFEALDPVRGLTNRSSGKMGAALVRAAFARGAEVTVVSGPVKVSYPSVSDIQIHWVESAKEMQREVLKHFVGADIFISAAAVCDYRVSRLSASKLKKRGGSFSLEFEENGDILSAVHELKKPHQRVVGFALETEDLVVNAKAKLIGKGLDLIVANEPSVLDQSYGEFTLLNERMHRSVRGTKLVVSHEILDFLI